MTTTIESLGDCCFLSCLSHMGPNGARFKTDTDQIVCDDHTSRGILNNGSHSFSLSFEIAGPRERMLSHGVWWGTGRVFACR